jgi:predicted LPLAT superfamily acyltransferase
MRWSLTAWRGRPDLAAAPDSVQGGRAAWLQLQERGSARLLRTFARASHAIGRGPSRVVLRAITAYFVVFAPRARAESRRYLRRALGREPSLADVFRHFFCFATTIHDRVFLARGELERFDVQVEGAQLLQAAMAGGRGALLIGAHLGSFEIPGAVGQLGAGVEVAMAMYEDNARKVRAMLDALQPRLRPRIIPLGTMDAMLQIRAALDGGAFVGVLADRTLGAEPAARVNVLGEPASLPTGPLRAAAMLRRPVIFMAGLHLGENRYRVVFAPLADFSAVDAASRNACVARAVNDYAALLTRLCREAPYNWFNFYDFWRA